MTEAGPIILFLHSPHTPVPDVRRRELHVRNADAQLPAFDPLRVLAEVTPLRP